MKITTTEAKCQNCGKIIHILDGNYFGIICPECSQKDNSLRSSVKEKFHVPNELEDFDLRLEKNASVSVVYEKDGLEIVLTNSLLKPEKKKATIQYTLLKF